MDFSLFKESWEMEDEIEEVVSEAVKVSREAFAKNREEIHNAWKRIMDAFEIIDKEGLLALDEVCYNVKSNNPFVVRFKECVIGFVEYVVNPKPIIEIFLNEIYLSKMEPVSIWVYLLYIYAFYIIGAKYDNKYEQERLIIETDEYKEVCDWLRDTIPEEEKEKGMIRE